MNSRNDVLDRLARLTRADRSWIVERLSPAARSALLDDRPRPGKSATTSNSPPAMDASDLAPSNTPNLAALAALLSKEPLWVTHALLSLQYPWVAELREQLPTSLRADLDRLGPNQNRYSRKLLQLLEERIRAVDASVVAPPEPAMRGGSEILARLANFFARRRMRLAI